MDTNYAGSRQVCLPCAVEKHFLLKFELMSAVRERFVTTSKTLKHEIRASFPADGNALRDIILDPPNTKWHKYAQRIPNDYV